MMWLGREVATALALRVLIAVLTQTFFQPDEYFQALEPAHHLVFGYGSLTWEWLNPLPIRGILYPALNVPIYWILKVSGLHSVKLWGDWLVVGCFTLSERAPVSRCPWLQILSPRILHGVLAAATDIFLCRLTSRVIGARYVPVAVSISDITPLPRLIISVLLIP